jgi:hypothetical protein
MRQCLVDVSTKTVHTKMVDRLNPATFPYRMLKSGIYVGNAEKMIFFPLPPADELRKENYRWWRSADM